MEFSEQVKREIEKCGTRYAFCKDTGLAESLVKRWEDGSIPSDALLKYFLFISKDADELKKNIENFIEKKF